jgi:hypothetical protein
MKLLPDTIRKSWLAARGETRAGEEKKETEFRERKDVYRKWRALFSFIFFLNS